MFRERRNRAVLFYLNNFMKPPEFERNYIFKSKVEYTDDELKALIKKAYETEIEQKEKEIGEKLLEEEKLKIKISKESLEGWHKAGLIPSIYTLIKHFGSIVKIANLLELPTNRSRPNESYYEGDRSEYIKALKLYIQERNPTRKELRDAVTHCKIPGVPSTIFNHININNLG